MPRTRIKYTSPSGKLVGHRKEQKREMICRGKSFPSDLLGEMEEGIKRSDPVTVV